MVSQVHEVLVRQAHEALVQHGQAPDAGVEDADGARIHSAILEPATLSHAMSRRLGLLGVAAAALVWSGSVLAATPQQLTIPMSDGVQLACSLVEPDGAPPTGGWPAVMLFHGLGGTHQDILEPVAVQLLAPAGYAALQCDARALSAAELGSGRAFGQLEARVDRDAYVPDPRPS